MKLRYLLVALKVAISAAFFVAPALAQNPGTVTNHAFAVGKGAGTTGFTSLLCGSAQLAVGQSAADPVCQTITGDVTINSSGVTAIGAGKVTTSQMATGTQDTALGYWGSTAASGNAIPNCTGALVYSTSTHLFTCNTGGGSGTVTSIAQGNGITLSTAPCIATCTASARVDGTTITDSGGPLVVSNTTLAGQTCTPGSTCGLATPTTNSLGANVALNNTANYFDGPSVAQGATGTWFASGSVTVTDTSTAANIYCKLWDGTTVVASAAATITVTSATVVVALSGFLASPAANIRISCRDVSTTAGVIIFNTSGNSKDSTITVVRVR